MKRLLLFAALLTLTWSPAGAQSVVQHGQSLREVMQALMVGGTNGGNGYMLQTDTNGNLYAIPAVATHLFDAISVTNLAVGVADSSEVLDVASYPYLKLLIKGVPRTGANTTVRLGVTLSECANGMDDTTSVFNTVTYGKVDLGTTQANIVDTVLAGHVVTGSISQSYSGEFTVLFNGNRTTAGTATALYSSPNGIDLPVDAIFGRQVRYSKLKIRVRNLNLNSPGVDVTIKVLGFTR